MTGAFSELVQYGLSLANDTDSHQDLRKKRQVTGAAAEKALYAVPYPEQSTGLTKYAPMATQPGTKITAKSKPPVYPTSAFSVARTFLPIPTWQTTLTASQTSSTSGIENPVSFCCQITRVFNRC
jgi:Yeast cell wall synthesis protein KRE9/KNH1